MVPQMLGIDFDSYSFYREIFAPIAPNERCSICSGVLVDFKFGIDYAVSLLDRNKYAVFMDFFFFKIIEICCFSLKSVHFGNISNKYNKW